MLHVGSSYSVWVNFYPYWNMTESCCWSLCSMKLWEYRENIFFSILKRTCTREDILGCIYPITIGNYPHTWVASWSNKTSWTILIFSPCFLFLFQYHSIYIVLYTCLYWLNLHVFCFHRVWKVDNLGCDCERILYLRGLTLNRPQYIGPLEVIMRRNNYALVPISFDHNKQEAKILWKAMNCKK